MGINNRILAWSGERQHDMEIAEATVRWFDATVRDGWGFGFEMNCGEMDAMDVQFELAIERLEEIKSDIEDCRGR